MIQTHRCAQNHPDLQRMRHNWEGAQGGDLRPELFNVCLLSPSLWASVGARWRSGNPAADWPQLRCSDNNKAAVNDNWAFSTSVYGNLFIDLDYKFWKLYMFNDFSPTLKSPILFQPRPCLNPGHCWINSNLTQRHQLLWLREGWYCNLNTQKTEEGGSGVWGQPRLV